MFKYNYYRAKTIDDLTNQLSKGKTRIIAGGTDLMVQIYEKDEKWSEIECLIDISHLEKDLRYIKEDEENIYIGAISTHTDIENSEIIKNTLPFLSEACGTVGSPQIRNLGTIGGSICNGSPASDPLTPLLVCDSKILIVKNGSEKIVNLIDFYNENGDLKLEKGEFVKEFILKKFKENYKTVFVKLGRRKALAISRLNVAVAVYLENGIIKGAKISPGCIFRKPDRLFEIEEFMRGKNITRELSKQVGLKVSEEMIKRTGIRWSTEYKKIAIEGIVLDALELIKNGGNN